MNKNNKFLSQLLDLEISGKDAISAPPNWTTAPLLNIPTEVNQIINEIAPLLIKQGNSDNEGIWWFLVGSPGNGKSAAVGSLVRVLQKEKSAIFREYEEGKKLGKEISEFGPDEIPYEMELYEDGERFSSALFAQDASVLPNPFDPEPDTGKALIDLLKKASNKGKSIVVCANRGIIERALQHKDKDTNADWYKALKAVHENTTDSGPYTFNSVSGRPVFKTFKIKVTPLDEKSIIADDTFKKLLGEATSKERWNECDDCTSKQLCPYKNNRDWLAEKEGEERFTKVLRYAELLSGQAIVFREALAFIALMLAGTSRDYKKSTPCEWVHEKVEKGAVFSLLSRRIYMLLFKSKAPFGLKRHAENRETQLETLSQIINSDDLSESSRNAIKELKNDKISTDVGLTRFLNVDGIFAEIDPVKENQGKKREQKWNFASDNMTKESLGQPLVGKLEEQCFAIWGECERFANTIEKKESHGYYRELRRWITSVTYRLGFFAEGKLLFEEELKEYQEILDMDQDIQTDTDYKKIKTITSALKEFVFDSNKVEISHVLTVSGDDVAHQLAPKLKLKDCSKARLMMRIGANKLELSPRSFAWLRRKSRTGLSNKTFPPNVQQEAKDLRYKAASNIDYAFIEGITLEIIKNNGDVLTLDRGNDKLWPR
jgi:hypothetical protein